MEKKLKKLLKLKDGSVFAVGERVKISVAEDRPGTALLVIGGREIKISSCALYKYFPGFVLPFIDPDFDGAIVPSLTGEEVEPDGWDEKGFPSILLAQGLI